MSKIAVVSVAHIHSHAFCKSLCALTSGKAPHVIWDENAERGLKYAAEFNCRFEPDLDKVLADKAVQGFVVCAENTRHLPLLRKVLPLGKPTLCEKPLATTVADVEEIVALARRHKTPLCSGYFQPFNASNRGVKKLLDEGALGKVTHLNFRNAHNAAYGRWFDSPALAWFAEPELSGGGALLDMGTHAVHLLRHLGGPVTDVWATHANFSGNYAKVDDYGLIVMKFASGVLGRVEAGWVFTGGHGGLEVIGSKKSIWNSDGLKIGAPKEPVEAVPPADTRPDRIERLLAMVRGEVAADELATDLEACRDAVKIMAAAYESSTTGTWVAVAKG